MWLTHEIKFEYCPYTAAKININYWIIYNKMLQVPGCQPDPRGAILSFWKKRVYLCFPMSFSLSVGQWMVSYVYVRVTIGVSFILKVVHCKSRYLSFIYTSTSFQRLSMISRRVQLTWNHGVKIKVTEIVITVVVKGQDKKCHCCDGW